MKPSIPKRHDAIDLDCPMCGCPMQAKTMPMTIYYTCPDCGCERAQDRQSGKLREPKYFGWKGD